MRKMLNEDVMGMSDRDQPLTPEEMLVARKTSETRCYTAGRYEVAIPWIDDEPPLYCNRKSAEDRLYFLERHQNEDRMMLRNTAKFWRKMKPRVTYGSWSQEKSMMHRPE